MVSSKDKTIVALIYDFDKTLCDKDMQEYSFIPSLGLSSEEFWEETDKVTEMRRRSGKDERKAIFASGTE